MRTGEEGQFPCRWRIGLAYALGAWFQERMTRIRRSSIRSLTILTFFCFGQIGHAETPATSPVFVVVVSANDAPLSDGKVRRMEIGDTLPFLRFVSDSELKGGDPDPADKKWSILQFGGLWLACPSNTLRPVPEQDIPKAALSYRGLVEASKPKSAEKVNVQDVTALMQLMLSVQGANSQMLNDQISQLEQMRQLGDRKTERPIPNKNRYEVQIESR